MTHSVDLSNKFYNHHHLFYHIERSYSDFLEHYLKSFFKNNSKVLVTESYNSKTQNVQKVYLNFGKYTLQQVTHRGPDRKLKVIDSELAIKNNLTRELSLKIEIVLSMIQNDDPTTETMLTRKIAYDLAQIPLLINSSYDINSTSKELKDLFFIIEGGPKILYNVLERNLEGFSFVFNSKNQPLLKIKREQKNPLMASFVNNEVCLYGRYLTQYRTFGQIFRLLNVSLKDVLDHGQNKVKPIQILSQLGIYYQKDLEKVAQQYESKYKVKAEEAASDVSKFFDLEPNSVQNIQLMDLFINALILNQKQEVLFMDSLQYKKLTTIKNHLAQVFNLGFKQMIQKALPLIVKDFTLIKKSRTLVHVVKTNIFKNLYKKYLMHVETTTNTPHAEHLNFNNQYSTYSNYRKIVSNLNKSLMLPKYRSVNPSKLGRICPVHSPHSKAVGLVEYMAAGAKLSHYVPDEIITKIFEDVSLQKGPTLVHHNGVAKGYVSISPTSYAKKIQKYKKKYYLGLIIEEGSINVVTTEGRLLRPLLCVQKGKLIINECDKQQIAELTLTQLIQKNYLVYVDTREEQECQIAISQDQITQSTTHLSLDGSLNLSLLGGLLPMVSNNAAHRASLTLRLYDQALGSKKRELANQKKIETLIKGDNSFFETPYTLNFEKLTQEKLGQNMIVCFKPEENEEDALVVNKTALERGLLDSIMSKRVVQNIECGYPHRGYRIIDKVPEPPSYFESDCLPRVGQSYDQQELALITQSQSCDKIKKVKSPANPFILNDICINTPTTGTTTLTYDLSKYRKAQVGDKLGTRHGLKGVISKLASEFDLPIPKNGISPSFFVSNHVINSRMILGPLLELYLTKAAIMESRKLTISSFVSGEEQKRLVDHAIDTLSKNGYNTEGKESFLGLESCNPCEFTVGPTKVFMLVQHARDKFYIRTKKGGVSYFTRQPGAGRATTGGLRFGEMEVNATIEHGAAEFLKDKTNIDSVTVRVCPCGRLSDNQKEVSYCGHCEKETYTHKLVLPYPMVLFSKILKASHIDTLFHLEEDQTDEPETDESFDQVNIDDVELQDTLE